MRVHPGVALCSVALLTTLLLGVAFHPAVAQGEGEICDFQARWDFVVGGVEAFNEKCEYLMDLDPATGTTRGLVGQYLDTEASRLVYELWLEPAGLVMSGRDSVCIFSLRDAAGGTPVVEVDLAWEDQAFTLQGRWRSDEDAGSFVSTSRIGPGGSVLTVEWVRSSAPDRLDGAIRLYLDGVEIAAAEDLRIVQHAPDQVSFGVVTDVAATTSGALVFKPLSQLWEYHPSADLADGR